MHAAVELYVNKGIGLLLIGCCISIRVCEGRSCIEIELLHISIKMDDF